jgi:hypothetical protein
MRRLHIVLATLVVAAALPAGALAAMPSAIAVDLPAALGQETTKLERERRFTLVGLHWRGTGEVSFRTRSLAGTWTRWRPAAPESEDGPDRGSAEGARTAGWHVGSPWWVGPSDRLEVRRHGRIGRVRAQLVWSPAGTAPSRSLAVVGTPPIVSRAEWGASESIRRGTPAFAPSVRLAFVHHTAGRSNYSRAEAAAVVRGIQLFHVQSNGWNDIGYNFLVDRFGTIYEGRFGGVERNVVGAHARGFNTGSTGIALIGTYGSARPSPAALDALASLISWRLDLAHADPSATVTALSAGNERFRPNVPVLLRRVSGHRDTGATACPGDALYGQLDSLGLAAAKLGGPKIFDPRIEADGEGLVRFRARASASLPWTVVVRSGGAEIARGTGTGTSVDWTWDAAQAAPATYTWTISAGSARPARGTIRAGSNATELAIGKLSATPAGITPNGDGQGDTALVTFALSRAANVTVEIADAGGAVTATVLDRVWTPAGDHSLSIDGASLADGAYSVLVRARTATNDEVVQTVPLTVSRTLGLVSVTPGVFSPNADGRLDAVAVGFSLAVPATVTVRIEREGRWIASPLLSASLPAGAQSVAWDGARSDGRLRDGPLSAVVEVSDAIGTVSFGVPFASDVSAPRARFLPGRRVRIEVSEAAELRIWINGVFVRRETRRAGTVLVRWGEPVRTARVVALDAAGNASAVVFWRPGAAGRGQ